MSVNAQSGDFQNLRMNPEQAATQGFSDIGVQKAIGVANVVMGLALFIIGCVAVAGHMEGVVAGGCIVGISVPMILTALGHDTTAKRVLVLIQTVALTIIGSLVIAGIIPPITAGWVVLSMTIPTAIVASFVCCIAGAAIAMECADKPK